MKETNASTGSGGDIYAAATGRHRAKTQISDWPEPPKDNTTGVISKPPFSRLERTKSDVVNMDGTYPPSGKDLQRTIKEQAV